MNFSYAIYLAVSGTISLLIAYLGWKRRSAPGALALMTLALGMAVWSLTYAAYWLTVTPSVRIFWMNCTYFGIAIAPLAFLALVHGFIGRNEWLTRRAYALLLVVPVLTLIFIWVPSLNLFFFLADRTASESVILRGGPWFYVFVVYSYALLMISMVLLFRMYLRVSPFYSRQARVMLLGAAIPWTVNGLVMLGWSPLPGLDLTPLAFAASGLFFAYGFFGYRMMDLVPVSRDVLVENLEDAIVVMDLQGRVVDLNPKAREFAEPDVVPFGRPANEAFPRWADLVARYAHLDGRVEAKLDRPPFSYFELWVIPLKNRRGQLMGQLASWRDITPRKQAEEQQRIFFQAVDQNPTMILITDPEGRIEYVNSQFTRLTGFTLDEVRGQTPRVLRSGETQGDVYKNLWATVKRGEVWEAEILNRKKDGDLYWAHELIAPVLDDQGEVARFVAMQEDITKRKRAETELRSANTRMELQLEEIRRLHAQLREESIRDGLTRLFNRRYMEETLERELSRAERDAIPLSVVMMDVDRFKSINDTLGHHTGDTVLKALGTLLLKNTRVGDIACRYGGDEMLVVLPGASLEGAVSRAEEWRAAFSLLEFSLPERVIRTSLSLGVASFPRHAHSPIELLVAADKALYKAKGFRNTVAMYDPATMAKSDNRSDDIR